MKRLLTSGALFLCSLLAFAQFSGSGSGTESDPYLILNPIQLNQMRNYLNQSGVYFKLMANIDVEEFIDDEWSSQGWLPIGTSSTPFKGVLDGNGKSISGFWINRPNTDYVGLFANMSNATIKNLTVNTTSIKGKAYVGVLTGKSNSTTISGSSVISTVEIIGSGNDVGGIAGSSTNGSISECRVTCKNITGAGYVGGTSGYGSTIPTCHVQGTVNGGDYVGGISGQSEKITGCNFFGDVNGNSYVGGLCGKTTSAVTNCYAIAHVKASGNHVGGLIGELYNGTLSDSYFCGTISGNEQVGGLVGHQYRGTINKCYANTNISGAKTIGGLVGKIESNSNSFYAYLNSNVTICTSIKATVGNVGRIYGERGSYTTIGEMGTTNENKAWNKAIIVSAGVAQDIEDNVQNGASVSATTLKLKATYVAMGWDFNDTWAIQETECYPYMKSQTAPPVIQSQVVSGETTVSGKCVDGGTITLEIDGVKQQMVSTGHEFSFTVSPLQAGHEVRVSAKAEGKEQSYFTTEVVSFLGKGTEADPYQISTAADLTQVYRKGYYKLMNDIDLTNYINQFSPTEGWESIGRDGSETIHFDGDGHRVSGLWCNSTRDNTGLFSCFANGSIKNLIVEVANEKQVKGGNNTGILIGKMMNGTIEKCQVSGEVADGTPVGGLVGLFTGGTILNCLADVNISTTLATSYVGGLVGEITEGTIDQCITTGTLTASGTESYIGGLVGKNSATISNCHSSAIVTSSYNAAGLVAYNYGVVDMCYAIGNLYSNNYAAGIIGYNDGANAVVSNCVAMNNKIEIVYESQQAQQGGGYGQRIIGGIKNNAPAPEMNNYALKTMQVSVNDVPQKVYDDIMNGVGKTESVLTECSTYQELGWNFSEVWDIDEGNEYPKLKWEAMINPSVIIRGDANGDEEVNVTDYMAIANYILGSTPINFNETAADVNTDGIVNVTDYVGVANIILYGNYQGNSPNAIKAKNTELSSTWMDIDKIENDHVDLLLHGAKPFSAFQMDIVLPEGMEISDAKMAKSSLTRNLGFARLPNGTWRLLYGTLENNPVSLVEDHLLTIELRTGKQNVGGNISIGNILLTKDNTSTLQLNDVFTNVITGINQMEDGEWRMENATIHDLSGRRISVSSVFPKGIYIINGKRIIK